MTQVIQVKQELRRWSSRYLNGVPIYPGTYVLTWVPTAGGWYLASMDPYDEKAQPA
jgi:hypothetical protein